MSKPTGGQEQYDSGADSDTPATEASTPTNDMTVDLQGPPPSGSGGNYATTEISSERVSDTRGNIVGPH